MQQLTDDVVLWTERLNHRLVSVASEALDNDLHTQHKGWAF